MINEKLLILGRIHWYLVAASKLVDESRHNLDLENNEINWWVYKRETDIVDLKMRTKTALIAAQQLKDASEKIAKFSRMTLQALEKKYEKFTDDQKENILIILDFVQWLYMRDPLAPAILFCFRTWGATRMANRSIGLTANNLNDLEELNQFTSVVLGFTIRGTPLKDLVRMDIEEELYEAVDEEYFMDAVIKAPESDVEIRTAYEASTEFAEFFEQLRDSLRNILIDIETRETEERLITSDDFWERFIIKAANSLKTEQPYWDFKETLEIWKPHPRDKKKELEHKFAERIGGFANNEGGVIIVGITDSFPRQIVGIGPDLKSVENNMKNTRRIIKKYISYKSDFVRLHQVPIKDLDGSRKLCLAIIIDQTYQPVGVKVVDGNCSKYPIREETGLSWEDPGILTIKKINVKNDNHHFLNILRQFVYESA